MSPHWPKIREVYNDHFPHWVVKTDERLLREPIGSLNFTIPNADESMTPLRVRECIDAVGAAFGLEFTGGDLSNLVTVQSLVDLVDDRTA